MPQRRSDAHRVSRLVAFSGMAAALSCVLMLLSGVIPIMTYAGPLMAGVLLLPVLLEFGKKPAWMTWAVTAVIVLLLDADREAALWYLLMGYYPIIVWQLNRIRSRVARVAVKLAYFALVIALLYGVLALLLNMKAMLAEFGDMGPIMTAAFFLLMLFCLMLYDRLLLPLCLLYQNRLRPRLKL